MRRSYKFRGHPAGPQPRHRPVGKIGAAAGKSGQRFGSGPAVQRIRRPLRQRWLARGERLGVRRRPSAGYSPELRFAVTAFLPGRWNVGYTVRRDRKTRSPVEEAVTDECGSELHVERRLGDTAIDVTAVTEP